MNIFNYILMYILVNFLVTLLVKMRHSKVRVCLDIQLHVSINRLSQKTLFCQVSVLENVLFMSKNIFMTIKV